MGLASSATAIASLFVALSPSVHAAEHSVLNVELEIVSAGHIAASEHFKLKAALRGHLSSSDAFAAIEIGNQEVAWTRPIFATRKPEWREKFFFTNVKPSTQCVLYVRDKDEHKDEALGQTQFSIVNTDSKETTSVLPIAHENKEGGGITVKVKSHWTPVVGDGKLRQFGPVHYSVHPSYLHGLITHTTTDEKNLESLAYHVHLHDIWVHLPLDIQWNQKHQPVRRIFSSEHPEAPVLRKMVESEHDAVYKHDGDTVYGEFQEAADFFKLLRGGKRRGKPVLYTYVIIETGWYFSETGASFFKDMLSKHMLHSRAQFHVRYAGEFFIEKDQAGGYVLHIDNNSGTYSPPKEELPQLKALLESNFPKLKVQAVDHDDEELKRKRKEIKDEWAK